MVQCMWITNLFQDSSQILNTTQESDEYLLSLTNILKCKWNNRLPTIKIPYKHIEQEKKKQTLF